MAKIIDATLKLIDQFSPTLKTVGKTVDSSKTSLKGVETAAKSAGSGIKSYSEKMAETEKINQRTAKSVDNLGKSMSGIGKIAAVASITAAAAEGFKLSQALDKATARVGMIGDLTEAETAKMKKDIVSLSNATGVASETIAEATQKAISGGVSAGDSMKYMENCIKMSKVAGVELNEVVNNTVAYSKAYNMTVEEQSRLNDITVKTAKLAHVELSKMVPALSGVAKAAADSGVSVEQMNAAYAFMVSHGASSEKSIASLESLFDSFSKSSPKAIKAAQEFGIELNQAHIKAVGFPAFLKEIQEKTGGNTEAISKIIGDVGAFKLAMNMTTEEGGKEFNEMLAQIQQSSGQTGDAMAKLKSPAATTAKAMNQIKNAGVELVDGLAPLWTSTAVMINGLVGAFNSLTDGQKATIFSILRVVVVMGVMSVTIGKAIGIFSGAFGSITTFAASVGKAGGMIPFLTGKLNALIGTLRAVGMAARVLFANPLGIAILAIIALVYLIYTHWDTVGPYFKAAWAYITGTFGSYITMIKGVLTGLITFITGVFTGNWSQAWQGVVQVFSSIFGMIAGICQNILAGVKGAINSVIDGINGMKINIPDWVPGVGGKSFQPTIPKLAKGTDNWQGGPAMIHDAGPEIVDLPNGSRVIPHSKSMQEEYNRGKAAGGKSGGSTQINIPKLADQIIVREDADIDKIVTALAQKLESYAMNQAEGAI